MGLMIPRFIEEKLSYYNEKTEQWELKENAPDWAKKEFEEFNLKVNPVPDENGIITQH